MENATQQSFNTTMDLTNLIRMSNSTYIIYHLLHLIILTFMI